MIIPHRDLPLPSNSTILWRYMPVERFIDLISSHTLYFRRNDCYDAQKEATLALADERIMLTSRLNDYWVRERKRHYVSCWIQATYELDYMWEEYSKEGIAIQTTVGNLKQSMIDDDEHIVYLSKVKYIDFQIESTQDHLTPINVLKIPFTKSKEYIKENEIRLLYTVNNIDDKNCPTSYKLPINVSKLFGKLILHRNLSQQCKQNIIDTLKREQLTIEIADSAL